MIFVNERAMVSEKAKRFRKNMIRLENRGACARGHAKRSRKLAYWIKAASKLAAEEFRRLTRR